MAISSASAYPTQSLLKALHHTIKDSKASATHLRETDDFLDSVARHLTWYDQVFDLLDRHYADVQEYVGPAVDETSKVICQLVEPVKRLCEGTTDRIPFELAILLQRELRDSTNDQLARVALCPLPNLNFLYTDFGTTVADLFKGLDRWLEQDILLELPEEMQKEAQKQNLWKPPALPSSHILIGCQYAMAEDILFNSVLFHEIGHHVFKIKGLWGVYREKFETELDEQFSKELPEYSDLKQKPEKNSQKRKYLGGARDICTRWTNEVFSDAFACAAIGPHFAFAMRDLFRLKPTPEPRTFSTSHPADLLRQFAQSRVLEDCGWFSQGNAPTHEQFLNGATAVFGRLRVDSSLGEPEKWQPEEWGVKPLTKMTNYTEAEIHVLLRVFFGRLLEIGEEAMKHVSDHRLRSLEFWCLGPYVKEALEAHAVVPSTLVIDHPAGHESESPKATPTTRRWISDKGETQQEKIQTYKYHPKPSTVLNSARLIMELGTEKLVQTCYAHKRSSIDRHDVSRCRGLLSEWARKAIGDFNLLKDSPNGGSP